MNEAPQLHKVMSYLDKPATKLGSRHAAITGFKAAMKEIQT
jgi:hypothetical protein